MVFINCTKNTNEQKIQDKISVIETEIIQKHNENISNLNDQLLYGHIIKNIKEYIYEDLNIKSNYKNINEILSTLNLSENYIINEYKEENTIQTGIGFLYFYDIEWEHLKITYFTSDYIDWFSLLSIEIEINENNYLHLFPYKSIEEYIIDKNIGKIDIFMNPIEKQLENNNLTYEIYSNIDDVNPEIYFRLIFDNGLLKSIKIFPYLP
jgi:hypothetical protein